MFGCQPEEAGETDTGECVAPIDEGPCPLDPSVSAGAFFRIYNPSVGEAGPWYINDHSFIRGSDGIWHLFGITHPEPQVHHEERIFAHATAASLTQAMWEKRPPALVYAPELGEEVLWAPHVIESDGTFYMFYASGGPEPTSWRMRLATSPDLETWTRVMAPLFTDGYEARDPFVIRIDRWVMYYTRTDPPSGGRFVVAYRTSDDLFNWSEPGLAFVDPTSGTSFSVTESPFVVERDGLYYLFIGPRGGYVGTDVFASADPLSFSNACRIGHIDAHAAEVVIDDDGAWYVSHAGWGQGGVFLAPLAWESAACPAVSIEAPERS